MYVCILVWPYIHVYARIDIDVAISSPVCMYRYTRICAQMYKCGILHMPLTLITNTSPSVPPAPRELWRVLSTGLLKPSLPLRHLWPYIERPLSLKPQTVQWQKVIFLSSCLSEVLVYWLIIWLFWSLSSCNFISFSAFTKSLDINFCSVRGYIVFRPACIALKVNYFKITILSPFS